MASPKDQSIVNTTSNNSSFDSFECGQWYWVRNDEGDDWLGCITHIGSNYAQLTSVYQGNARIHFDEWSDAIRTREEHPEMVMDREIQYHRRIVSDLMDEIKRLTARLGLT